MRLLSIPALLGVIGCAVPLKTVTTTTREERHFGEPVTTIVQISGNTFDVTFRRSSTCVTQEVTSTRYNVNGCSSELDAVRCTEVETRELASRDCGETPAANEKVLIVFWDGGGRYVPTNSNGTARVALSDLELRLPYDPAIPFATVSLDKSKPVPIEVSANVFAASILARSAFDEIERFQRRFGQSDLLASLLHEQEVQTPPPVPEPTPGEQAVARVRAHLEMIKGPRGWCYSCEENTNDLLQRDAATLRELGQIDLARQIETRRQGILRSRDKWLKDKRIPAAATVVWALGPNERGVIVSQKFSPAIQKTVGNAFELPRQADVDRVRTAVTVVLEPDQIFVNLTFRPDAPPCDEAYRSGPRSRIPRIACPIRYAGYVRYAFDAARAAVQRAAVDPAASESMKAWSPRSVVVSAWTDTGQAMRFGWSVPRLDMLRLQDALLFVEMDGRVYSVDRGLYTLWEHAPRLDARGDLTGVGALERFVDLAIAANEDVSPAQVAR